MITQSQQSFKKQRALGRTRLSMSRTQVVWTLRGKEESCTFREKRYTIRESCGNVNPLPVRSLVNIHLSTEYLFTTQYNN